MLPDEKNTTQLEQPAQQVIIFSNTIDFNATDIKAQMMDVQKEVNSVMEGAIVDASKLSFNFTV